MGWVDVYYLRQIDYEKEYYFGINYKKGTVNNCVLKLPRQSAALHLKCNFPWGAVSNPILVTQTSSWSAIKTDFTGQVTNVEFAALDNDCRQYFDMGIAQHRGNQKRTTFFALLAFWFCLEQRSLDPEFDFEFEAKPVRFIHLFISTKLQLRDACEGILPKRFYMQKICDRNNISTETAPIPHYRADPLLTNEMKIPA